jgi:excisionase family DNA binding protein
MTDGHKSAPLLYSVKATAAALSLGQSTVWALIKAGRLKAVKIGRATRIPHEELERLAGVKG